METASTRCASVRASLFARHYWLTETRQLRDHVLHVTRKPLECSSVLRLRLGRDARMPGAICVFARTVNRVARSSPFDPERFAGLSPRVGSRVASLEVARAHLGCYWSCERTDRVSPCAGLVSPQFDLHSIGAHGP